MKINFKENSSVASALDHFLDQIQFVSENSEDVMYFGVNGGYREIPEGLVVRSGRRKIAHGYHRQ